MQGGLPSQSWVEERVRLTAVWGMIKVRRVEPLGFLLKIKEVEMNRPGNFFF